MARKQKATPTQIEAQYDSGQNRLTQERSDFLLPQIIDFVRQKRWINIRPEYQRRLVWDQKKKSLFIESLLMNIPVPPVFLYETDLSRYEVMDGQQRLNAVVEFYDGKLKLKGLETWSVLNGMTYHDCPPRIKSGLDRRRISATVLVAESASSPEQIDFTRKTVFQRINTGGAELNAQELRNSLYSGPFNEMLIELAGNKLFDTIWQIPPYEDYYRQGDGFIDPTLASNRLFKRMGDCELVLRFFAFRNTKAIRGSVRSMLDRCMAENRDALPAQIDEFKKVFLSALDVAHRAFKLHTFQIPNDKGVWVHSIPLYDGTMVAIDSLSSYSKEIIANGLDIQKSLLREIKKKEVYEIVVGKPNTATAVKDRIQIITDIIDHFC